MYTNDIGLYNQLETKYVPLQMELNDKVDWCN